MNIYRLPEDLTDAEFFETLVRGKEVLIERIISTGQSSPDGFWYDQDKDEWVVLLQGRARIRWEDGREISLAAGECLMIPAHDRHRVEETSETPPCIWLAVHGKLFS